MKKNKLLTTIALLSVVLFAGCRNDDYVAIDGGPCPVVVSTTPVRNATLVGRSEAPASQQAVRTTLVTAKFNKKIDARTINSSTFIVKATGGANLTGTVSYSDADSTATFTSANKFADNTTYEARVTTGVKDLIGNALQADYVWPFATGTTLLPIIIATDPAHLSNGVPINKTVTATFSVPMNQTTINTTTFTLKNGIIVVPGVVSTNGAVASYDPTNALIPSTVYTAKISKLILDQDGSAMVKDSTWTFTTAATPPTIINTNPADKALNVPLNTTVSALFSVPMNASSFTNTTFSIRAGVNNVVGVVNYSGSTATFNPTNDFLPNTIYTAHITTGVNNSVGTALTKDTVWTFTTADIIPEVVFTDPANLDANVLLNKTIAATFNVAMDATTFSNSTFTLKEGINTIAGVVSFSGVTATFNPNSDLAAGVTYTANITTGVKSVTNKSMLTNHQWQFTTPANTVVVPFIDLKSVARFGIISGVGVSNNAGASVINNLDVGIYPGARSSITGFPPATVVNGKIYAADDGAAIAAMLKQAKLDLVAAYLFAAGLPASATISGNQGGKTLAPGVYKSTSTLSVDGSPLTLDAQGDPNAYWVFQVASTFTTTTGGSIVLAGGAQAKNIFWQTGSSATIGTYTTFYGSIMALQSITMDPYAVATGRMLAQNAAVTMTSTNIINKP